jgi:hypothetical protein
MIWSSRFLKVRAGRAPPDQVSRSQAPEPAFAKDIQHQARGYGFSSIEVVTLVEAVNRSDAEPVAFGAAQHQQARRIQRIVKRRKYLALRFRIQVDEDITATHHVETGEGWIFGHVMPCEDAAFADHLVDLISAVGL